MLSSWHSPFKQTGTKTNAETDGVIVTAIRARRKKKTEMFTIHHSFNLAVSYPASSGFSRPDATARRVAVSSPLLQILLDRLRST